MLELDWRVETHGGVALVELVVSNPTATPRRVRVADRLDGPTWPPRREGVPEAGWDDGGFEGVVAPGDRRALGYASPVAESPSDDATDSTDSATTADAAEPPAELVWSERAGASAAEGTASEAVEDADAFTDEATPEGLVRALGDARPPADAVPTDSDSPASSGRSP